MWQVEKAVIRHMRPVVTIQPVHQQDNIRQYRLLASVCWNRIVRLFCPVWLRWSLLHDATCAIAFLGSLVSRILHTIPALLGVLKQSVINRIIIIIIIVKLTITQLLWWYIVWLMLKCAVFAPVIARLCIELLYFDSCLIIQTST